jgi:hypothetical protein
MSEKLTTAQAQTMANIIKQFLQERIEPIDLELAAHAVLLEKVKQTDPDLLAALCTACLQCFGVSIPVGGEQAS